MIYLLRHPDHPTVSYVGQAGATRRSILERSNLQIIKQHLNKNLHLLWEILELIPAHFRTPIKIITTLETKWADRLRGKDGLNNTLTIKFEMVFTVQALLRYLIKSPHGHRYDPKYHHQHIYYNQLGAYELLGIRMSNLVSNSEPSSFL